MTVGVVVRPHGLRGEILVDSWTEVAERFAPGAALDLLLPDGSRRTAVVERALTGPRGLRLTLAGVDDRDAALALRGGHFEVERSQVPAAPAGAYWWFELVGARCFDERDGELGELVEVVESPGGILLVVALVDGRTLPLPFVDSFLVAVDVAARRIDWRLPEGLLEACASKS